jgi:hypothetical protein
VASEGKLQEHLFREGLRTQLGKRFGVPAA